MTTNQEAAKKIKLRITALQSIHRRYGVDFMGVRVAVAFGRDSGAKVGRNVRMIDGDIDSGGSRVNWYCSVDAGSVFELEVDAEFYRKYKNRIQNWAMQEIDEFAMTLERAKAEERVLAHLE